MSHTGHYNCRCSSGPLLQFRTDLSLIPDAAPAACCVLPFISFCLINTTCRSVINLLTSCEGDNHLYQPANSSVVTGKSYCRVSLGLLANDHQIYCTEVDPINRTGG